MLVMTALIRDYSCRSIDSNSFWPMVVAIVRPTWLGRAPVECFLIPGRALTC